MIENSFELLKALKNQGYIKEERDALWWPNSGSFEVVIGAILTQNTNWSNVEKALDNLRKRSILDLESLHQIEPLVLAQLIRPSGFYNQKAKRLKELARNIYEVFGDFESFQEGVSREWLLAQKGVGQESADSILCYACGREEMVCDSYTHRILKSLGWEMDEYIEIKSWLEQGIERHYDDVCLLYGKECSLNFIYARFHGKIVEFCKDSCRGKVVDLKRLEQ